MSKILILGASGHVGRSLAFFLAQTGSHQLVLTSRKIGRILKLAQILNNASVVALERLWEHDCDIIVNCIGAGGPQNIRELGPRLMHITEQFDNAILEYLDSHKDTLYVSLSSGEVYGLSYEQPISDETPSLFPVNELTAHHCYGIAKLNAESKHRARLDRNIVDYRIFGYVSRFLDIGQGFFLAEVLQALLNGAEFSTSPADMTRDFIHPQDLCRLIELCAKSRPINIGVDVRSRAPTTKFAVLEKLTAEFGLRWNIMKADSVEERSNDKPNYYATTSIADSIGFVPEYTALDAVTEEFEKRLSSPQFLAEYYGE